MKTKQPSPAPVEPLYYRLYVLYFEGEQAVLKTINTGAFFRISIWNKEVELATMVEGLNPVMLANKMFLGSTSINFSHASPPHRLQARLGSHVNSCDYVMGSAELDLEDININFTERGERFSGQESIPFALKEGELRLVFNIFAETGKVELDSSIREFKRFEKQVNRLKRIEIGREKMSQVGDVLRMSAELVFGLPELPVMVQNSSLQLMNIESEYDVELSDEVEYPETKKQSNSQGYFDSLSPMEPVHSDLIKVESGASGQYLEINSAALAPMGSKQGSKVSKLRAILNQIEQNKNTSAISSQVSSFQHEFEQKTFLRAVGQTSVLSDGSQASEMIANNLTSTYSQRAVARFKGRVFRCINATVIILAIVLFYFLVAPSTKFSKPAKHSRSKVRKMKDNWLEF